MSDKPATTQPAAQQPQAIRVGPNVPEIYMDGYQGVQFKDGVLKLNLFSTQLDPASNATYNDVVARLTMSVPTLASVYNALGGLLKELEDANVIKIRKD